MNIHWKTIAIASALTALVGCSQSEPEAPKPTVEVTPEAPAATVDASEPAMGDGELAMPDYKGWPVMFAGIDKPNNQVRDLYINPTANDASGAPLPNGSQLVMEIYAAEVDEEGNAVLDADGKMQKGALSKVFVMGKDEGWGADATIANGSWVYSAYNGDGSVAEVDYNSCRGCHAPLTEEDYVPRLNEYLSTR